MTGVTGCGMRGDGGSGAPVGPGRLPSSRSHIRRDASCLPLSRVCQRLVWGTLPGACGLDDTAQRRCPSCDSGLNDTAVRVQRPRIVARAVLEQSASPSRAATVASPTHARLPSHVSRSIPRDPAIAAQLQARLRTTRVTLRQAKQVLSAAPARDHMRQAGRTGQPCLASHGHETCRREAVLALRLRVPWRPHLAGTSPPTPPIASSPRAAPLPLSPPASAPGCTPPRALALLAAHPRPASLRLSDSQLGLAETRHFSPLSRPSPGRCHPAAHPRSAQPVPVMVLSKRPTSRPSRFLSPRSTGCFHPRSTHVLPREASRFGPSSRSASARYAALPRCWTSGRGAPTRQLLRHAATTAPKLVAGADSRSCPSNGPQKQRDETRSQCAAPQEYEE